MPENPYFQQAGAPLNDQLEHNEQELDGTYEKAEDEQADKTRKDDGSQTRKTQSEQLRPPQADTIYE